MQVYVRVFPSTHIGSGVVSVARSRQALHIICISKFVDMKGRDGKRETVTERAREREREREREKEREENESK